MSELLSLINPEAHNATGLLHLNNFLVFELARVDLILCKQTHCFRLNDRT